MRIIIGRYVNGMNKLIIDITHLPPVATNVDAFEAATNSKAVLASNDAQPLQLFTKMAATSPISATSIVPSFQPGALTSFPGKCFNSRQQHRSQECLNKKITMLVEETPGVEVIEGKLVRYTFKDLEYLPKG